MPKSAIIGGSKSIVEEGLNERANKRHADLLSALVLSNKGVPFHRTKVTGSKGYGGDSQYPKIMLT